MIAMGIAMIIMAIVNNYVLKKKGLWWYKPKAIETKETKAE